MGRKQKNDKSFAADTHVHPETMDGPDKVRPKFHQKR